MTAAEHEYECTELTNAAFKWPQNILVQTDFLDFVSALNRRIKLVIILSEQDPDAAGSADDWWGENLSVCVCVTGVLDSGGADFEDGEEVYDAIGGVLQEVSADSKNEDDVRDICLQMFNTLKL